MHVGKTVKLWKNLRRLMEEGLREGHQENRKKQK